MDINRGAITWMLLTYKIKHNRNFSEELKKARKVAGLCIKHQTQKRNLNLSPIKKPVSSFSFSPSSSFSTLSEFSHDFPIISSTPSPGYLPASDSYMASESLSPMDVKHIGLKSTISSQILKKYYRNREFRSVKNVKLIIPSRAVSVDRKEQTLTIPCLKLTLKYRFSNDFKKISQIEIDSVYAYVAIVFPDD